MDVGVRELRDGLSRHLAHVKNGHTITVTDHGHVACLRRDAWRAAAIAVNAPDLVAASGEARLLAAWHAEGVGTRDTNR